jgi:predicted acyl esterase
VAARWVIGMAVAGLLAGAPRSAQAFVLQPGIGLLAVAGAPVGAELILEDARGREVARGNVDSYGSLLFRELEQGRGYTVRESGSSDPGTEAEVLRFKDHLPASFYAGKTLVEGFQYIETRDGTLLAAMVRPPLSQSFANGPFPTVIEYSGYPAADPESPQPSTQLANALGFATVAVNMRGSGCSGGTLDLFDLPTTADGYDIVETVAAQSWVRGGKVGMVGISFPGISQLFVAGARPPHLAAVAPLSVISDIYRAPGFPGGIFNNGFAESWLEDRKADSQPAPAGGQGYAIQRVMEGDDVCLANQSLRLQTLDPIDFVAHHPFYEPALMDARSPIHWVSKIKVPVFLSGAWQDEQTSADFAALLARLPKRKNVKITVLNGVHASPIEPEILFRWLEFLQIYLADSVPSTAFLAGLVAPVVYPEILGDEAPLPPFPEDRFAGATDVDAARRVFEADPRVRVLMENGAGTATAGLPAPTFELGFKKWPPREARPTTWYLGPDGTLQTERPKGAQQDVDRYAPDPEARPMQTLPGQGESDSWAVIPPYDWQPLADGTALAYATPPLAEDVAVVGPGSVDLYLRSSAADSDLQVTLSEIRPDDLETYVQSGWLRASHRRLDKRSSTRLEPRPTHLEDDFEPLPAGEFVLARVGLFAVSHVFRAGSRIRISIAAPGGDRTRWAFDTPTTGGLVTNEIARSAALPSRVVLPILADPPAPQALPPCPGLRGQPCRSYVPAANGG